MDTSGLPCPDMSKAGKGLREEGLTSSVFIAHAKLHCAKKTPLLVVENVEDIIITSDHVRCFKNNLY
jgi:site-specific DNA-cytosine methylase